MVRLYLALQEVAQVSPAAAAQSAFPPQGGTPIILCPLGFDIVAFSYVALYICPKMCRVISQYCNVQISGALSHSSFAIRGPLWGRDLLRSFAHVLSRDFHLV